MFNLLGFLHCKLWKLSLILQFNGWYLFLIEQVLVQHPANLYAANGAGVILAEKGQFDVSKDIFTQVSTCILLKPVSCRIMVICTFC